MSHECCYETHDRKERCTLALWTCPECAFTFHAQHVNEDGTTSCPCCDEQRITNALRAFLDECESLWAIRAFTPSVPTRQPEPGEE